MTVPPSSTVVALLYVLTGAPQPGALPQTYVSVVDAVAA
jgi:hypothetical protein